MTDVQRLPQGIYRLQLVDKLFSKIVPFYNIILFDIIIELLTFLQREEASEMENVKKSEDIDSSEKADDQEKSENKHVKDPTTGIKVSTK